MRWCHTLMVPAVAAATVLGFPLPAPHAQPAQKETLTDAAIEQEHKRFETESGVKAPCAMPKVSDQGKVALLRASAEALSTVAIGSQDVVIKTGAIVVEAGSEPIYLIVGSFQPVIWRISGAVERVERLVLAGSFTGANRGDPREVPLIGATGIAPSRVTFLGHPHCLHLYEPGTTWIDSADRRIAYATGRANVRRGDFGMSAVSEVSVPSFTYKSLRERRPVPVVEYLQMVITGSIANKVTITGRNDLEAELRIFNPGGVIQIDAQAVVASQPVAPYEVLPQQAGLIQLLQSGALTRDDNGNFTIEQKIRLPAELNGGHKMLLRRGVPAPDGRSGDSCLVISEEGHTGLDGRRCWLPGDPPLP